MARLVLMDRLNDFVFIHPGIAFCGVIALIILALVIHARRARTKPRTLQDFEKLGTVTPLVNFDWTKEPPRKWRPFKKVYNLTMALEKASLNDLITIDRNHLTRITERRRLQAELGRKAANILHHDHACYTFASSGVSEFYSLITAYVPVRYPSMYTVVKGMFWQPSYLHCGLTCPASKFMDISPSHARCDIPVDCPEDVREGLENVSKTLDEDFLILVPAQDGDGYILGAYVACFPQGFDTSTLLGKRVRDIHGPVPGYKERLQGSMERFFDRLPVGKFVRRVNWSIATTSTLYTGDIQTHFHADEDRVEEEIRAEECFQRSEAQILFRLPKSGALVFVIKTYIYSLKEVKDEELGGELAEAVEGLQKGNVKEIFTYKRGPVWGEKVMKFLRS